MTFKEFILTKYSKTYKNLNGKRAATLISIEQILFEYDKFEQLNKPAVMQAGSEKQPYFKLSTNEFGKHWLFYKPSEPGKYSCWMPIDDEFYSEFDRMLKAALGSEATVGDSAAGKGGSVDNACPVCGGKFAHFHTCSLNK